MTYKEKLEELLGTKVSFDGDGYLIINRVMYGDNCPTSWFEMPNGKFHCDANDNCLTPCWNKEYQGEEYIGEIPIGKSKSENDPIHSPSHYTAHNIEVIDFIQDWDLNFALGNVVKYICRSPFKGNQLEDLKKAKQYLEFEIEKLENE